MTRAVCGDIPEQMRDDALRQVISFNFVADGQVLHLGNEAPVAADDTFEQTLVAEVIQASLLSVALARCVNKRQVSGLGAEALVVGR